MKRLLSYFLFIFLAAFALPSCWDDLDPDEETPVTPSDEASENLKALKYLRNSIMKVEYYWYDQVPDVSYDKNTDIEEYFDKLLVPQDRWSWMTDAESYISSEQGVVYGTYGVSISQAVEYYNDYDVKIKFVYPDSPFAKAGVKRGWTITHIDDVEAMTLIEEGEFVKIFNEANPSVPHKFTFTDNDGKEVACTIAATNSLLTRPALVVRTFTAEDYPGLTEPVGYFHYLSFKAGKSADGTSMLDDISQPMAFFRREGIRKLIIDLRYNNGGEKIASDSLVSYIASTAAEGQIYTRVEHNKLMAKKWNNEVKVHRSKDALNLDCLYFITGQASASASEVVINGLRPLMNIQHVGDTTYGKPNGMYIFPYPADNDKYSKGDYSGLKYVFYPICFYNLNRNYEKIPDKGIIPDNYRPDDLYHDFDAKEDNIAACLHHIVHGTYPQLPEMAGRDSWDCDYNDCMISIEPEKSGRIGGFYTVKF